jgi:hypothetical protein
MPSFEIGSLVHCRERDWVILPSERQDILLLRPLGGSETEVCGIYLPLEGNHITGATFQPPDPQHASDFVSGQLLRNAARLSLRSGAGPFRSLGRLGVRPPLSTGAAADGAAPRPGAPADRGRCGHWQND